MSAPVVMVQGTASGVGKSAVAAGLCRILRRRGLRVAPFKAQNMSNNAAVTADGGEIGRSTAVQAAAAGVEPTVEMNPVLLKPEANARSQVVVLGRVWATLGARDYVRHTPDLWPVVVDSLDRLRARYDVVVAEGAGSPAELNLRDWDIVNMRVARHSGAAVLLVGDIDRGGVFAQLLGTLDLLPPEERALVRGLVVNRFRGDRSLFADGIRLLEGRSGLPVFGVVPTVRDLGLAEEDGAVLEKQRPTVPQGESAVHLRIAVVRLPRIANFDEFSLLERVGGVVVEYVDRPTRLADADLIILPGTKATIADLAFLREHDLAEAITAARGKRVPILGICGGYQMLGRAIHDPHGVESPPGSVPGLGLLHHETVFERDKRTARVRARVVAADGPLAGARGRLVDAYEIHAGHPIPRRPDAGRTLLRLESRSEAPIDEPEGIMSADGLVLGSSLHGLPEDEAIRRSLVAWLRRRSASPPGVVLVDAAAVSGDPFDRWGDVLEASLDIERLLAVSGIPTSRRHGT